MVFAQNAISFVLSLFRRGRFSFLDTKPEAEGIGLFVVQNVDGQKSKHQKVNHFK